MARSVTSCTGETFTIGDKVRTPDGSIITVRGAAIGVKFHNAEACTKATAKDSAAHAAAAKKPKAGPPAVTDCIIWGD